MKLIPSPQVFNTLVKLSTGTSFRSLVTSVSRCGTGSTITQQGHKLNQIHSDRVQFPSRALTSLTEDEIVFKESGAKFAKEKIEPLVRAMDHSGTMDLSMIKGLFDNGVS